MRETCTIRLCDTLHWAVPMPPTSNMYPCLLLGTTYSHTGTVLPLLSYNSASSTYMCAVTEANQGCDNSAPAN